MDAKPEAVAGSFDARARTYNQNDWHRHVADALVAHCRLRSGDTILDARTGTGFAAVAAARAVGPQGRVPVADALAEWSRVLKAGGRVGFTTVRAGSSLAAQLFRDAAAAAGLPLEDPSAALGSEAACDAALGHAGFVARTVSPITVPFSGNDASVAWASNLGSPAHAAVHALGADRLDTMRIDFEGRVALAERLAPGSTASVDVLLASGKR